MTVARGNDRRRRVRVWFGTPCADDRNLLWAYGADVDAAAGYQAFMAKLYPGLTVTVDRIIPDDLRPLPCERLWTLAP